MAQDFCMDGTSCSGYSDKVYAGEEEHSGGSAELPKPDDTDGVVSSSLGR